MEDSFNRTHAATHFPLNNHHRRVAEVTGEVLFSGCFMGCFPSKVGLFSLQYILRSISMHYGCISVATCIIVYYARIVVYSCITPSSVYLKTYQDVLPCITMYYCCIT